METLLEILKYTIPSIIMLIGVYIVISKIYKQESERRNFELFKLNKDIITPVRVHAYERLILFLHRTTPEALLTRFDIQKLNVVQLQQMLHQAVRDEYEHNVSQQLYVSNEAWTKVEIARESIIQLINTCAAQLKGDAPAMELAKIMLPAYAMNENTPTEQAIEYLKREMHTI